ncbi:MAG: hypothetical protein MK052_10255 [Alphaproteobacteria bacterium]|nr:hypothetical protein [Alphaproteobacteria bacterium]
MAQCAVIIPVSASEPSLPVLLESLQNAGWTQQIWVSGKHEPENLPEHVYWLQSGGGRAHSMNAAAYVTPAIYLWFLHADSVVNERNVAAVYEFAQCQPSAIGYFDLRFYGGTWPMRLLLMRITEAGVWFRSRLFKAPFGDQGLCMSKVQFQRLGGYSEKAPYGEDHLLVLQAQKKHISCLPVNSSLLTSARKYHKNGWFATTALHLKLWWKQRQSFGRLQ